MKILSLNTWHGGKLKEEITQFIAQYAGDVDIFCFQEAKECLDDALVPLREAYTEIQNEKIGEEGERQQRTFVRNEFPILQTGDVLKNASGNGLGLWVHIETPNGPLWICNFHGVALPGDKLDNEERLHASQTLIDIANTQSAPKIIMGDFNLEKETESVLMLERAGFRNLIRDFDIPTTRNHYSWDKYPESKQLFADYTFVKGVEVKHFEVPPDEVSDHQAMILEIDM